MWEVVIIGAGPAGIFSALELSKEGKISVLLLEKGRELEERRCPSREKGIGCQRCSPCSILSGWGGAGPFSDGKLVLSSKLKRPQQYGQREMEEVLNFVDWTFLSYGAPKKVYGCDQVAVEGVVKRAARFDLKLIPHRLRHLGTENCKKILGRMRDALKKRVEIRTGVAAEEIMIKNGRVEGVRTSEGEIRSKFVVVAPGREGSSWLMEEVKRVGLGVSVNPVDVGVRVEVAAEVMKEICEVLYEPKIHYYSKSFDDQVRTFCVNPNGEVVIERYEDVITVNGHSYNKRKTLNTNLALLVTTSFTHPFHDPILYGKYLAGLANVLSNGVIIQRLGDLRMGRRSTPTRIERGVIEPTLKETTPGDLSFVFPYRYIADIIEAIDALDRLIPGFASPHTLLYGLEVKFYSFRVETSDLFETEIANLFCVGDGAGVSRGLVPAASTGVIAAREIVRRLMG